MDIWIRAGREALRGRGSQSFAVRPYVGADDGAKLAATAAILATRVRSFAVWPYVRADDGAGREALPCGLM